MEKGLIVAKSLKSYQYLEIEQLKAAVKEPQFKARIFFFCSRKLYRTDSPLLEKFLTVPGCSSLFLLLSALLLLLLPAAPVGAASARLSLLCLLKPPRYLVPRCLLLLALSPVVPGESPLA